MPSETASSRSRRWPPSPPVRPVVFVGPSLSHDDARGILDAEYRPPIRRGDLDGFGQGIIVAIIDGVFDQQLAVTPSELRAALARGARIFGASSMGALRAVEVPGVVGVGRIYEMFRDGVVDRDDEVAVTFDAQSLTALCQPLVNIRHALERLAATGTLARPLAKRILRTAQLMPYFDRTYPLILARVGLDDHRDAAQLAEMLASHDLKREDAITLLEYLRNVDAEPAGSAPRMQSAITLPTNARDVPSPDEPLHLWEFGPPLPFRELIEFLAFTGGLRAVALRAVAALASEDIPEITDASELQALFDRRMAQIGRTWHWLTEEEVTTSLRGLGIGTDALQASVVSESIDELRAMVLLRNASAPFLQALRNHLFLDELMLKREAARALSLRWLATRATSCGAAPSAHDRDSARRALCRQLDVRDFKGAVRQLSAWGITPSRCEDFVTELALARRAWQADSVVPQPNSRRWRWLPASRKAAGSRRFCMPAATAYKSATRLRNVVGITRVAMITGLGTLGIPNAQAFRPDGQWSSTVGSGKSESAIGARIGAIMEEVEKWAQERYSQNLDRHVVCVSSYRGLRRRAESAVDPATLDLPYDSQYSAKLVMPWVRGFDLAAGAPCLLPAAAASHMRLPLDIYYSPQGARKTVTTNGLASGMTLAEALTHALCEYVERHARTIDAIVNDNPGAPYAARSPVTDLDRAPASTRRLLRRIERAGYRLVARSIAVDIAIPTFIATILLPEGHADGTLFGDGWQQASGWAAHPDPETALNMAILEASQTIMSHIAGAREDLTLAARSLGRHERTESRRRPALVPEFDGDAPRLPFDAIRGLVSDDAAADVRWIVARLRDAGLTRIVMIDYSIAEIAPARVVRVIVPGLETTNPFHTGMRARIALLSDLLGVQYGKPRVGT
ncbi:hypothetical protein A8H32_21615 [Burkholderia thailandensis]|nr:hypothetical protein A8H32_21615 [Burkholderia thailandensis]PNE78170.1 hypothetical protein A8H37_08105 [Burkholderia thailandensis]